MHAAGGYSEQDGQNCTLQMAVCWHCNEIAPPNFPVSVVHQPTRASVMADISNLTTQSMSLSFSICSKSPSRPKDPPEIMHKSISSSSSTRQKRNSYLPPGAKEIRKTLHQTQQTRINKKKQNNQKKKAMKEESSLYQAKKAKNEKKQGAALIANKTNKKHRTKIFAGSIGQLPLKKGPDGSVLDIVFKSQLLKHSFESKK